MTNNKHNQRINNKQSNYDLLASIKMTPEQREIFRLSTKLNRRKYQTTIAIMASTIAAFIAGLVTAWFI